jgi:hypothetical protein
VCAKFVFLFSNLQFCLETILKKDLETVNQTLSGPLYRIAQLTLNCPDVFSPSYIGYPIIYSLEDLIEELHSKEAKAFIRKIKDKVVQHYDDKTLEISLDADELETVRKIYDEARILIEKGYRNVFHKLPPDDWYLTIADERGFNKHVRLSYKLP